MEAHKLMDGKIEEAIALLQNQIKQVERNDRHQSKQIRIIQKLQSALIGVMAIGLLLNQQAIQDPANRSLLERVAIGIVAASVSGLGLSGFVGTKEEEVPIE